ncbi:aspartyl/asparaginyl beta-hydroxylase domain-containing protein [Cupriavidus taiwanensis]|uniref:aspartyl/asparaginyl beta-hydroxylase domain-containing protein n=1 Tax=Cupriavidus taiwanensis TaxID=164546 RepID=UPI001C2DD29F|nr:aspartyl/asparaginyl beta-hydroxylase domain-containing protein [Cupriavidus taiwanensis]
MRNFVKVAEGADVLPLLLAVAQRPHLWNANPIRTTHPGTAHAQVDDILLRFNVVPGNDPAKVIDDTECINYPALAELPEARALIFGLMAKVQGERLGRCMITRLKPGGRILPHADAGAPATYYERFHVVLLSAPGCVFRAGDEQLHMRTGDVYWFDNEQVHEVVNNSAEDRVHLIIDIKTSK